MAKQIQLSETAIRERLRAKTPEVLERLVELVQSHNPSVALGACRLILDKVVPNIKPTITETETGLTRLNIKDDPRILKTLLEVSRGLIESGNSINTETKPL